MSDVSELEKQVVQEYVLITAKKGSKEFHLHYEYYLSVFYFTQSLRLIDPKEIERNFLITGINLINAVRSELDSESVSGLDVSNSYKALLEVGYSVILLTRKLSKIGSTIKTVSNPYTRVFINDFAYNCFEQLRAIVNNDLADYSFIYRKMIADELIFESVGVSEFTRFLSTNYEVEIDQMKQLYLCSTETKEQLYTTIKDSIS